MRKSTIDLRAGFEHAYVDGNLASIPEYTPSFVSNNPSEGKKVICSIEDELLKCDEFKISVAFVTMGGIAPLLQTFRALEKKGIRGKILTTNYLNFSEPEALKRLNSLSNIELKMFDVESANAGFHTKGYIFRKDEIFRIIIGSSNLTKSALTTNLEWNTKLVSTEQGEVTKQIIQEFDVLWNSDHTLSFDEFHEVYEERYRIIKHQREIARRDEIPSFEKYTLKPNSMQEQFIVNLRHLLEQNEYKRTANSFEIESVIRNLTNEFAKEEERKKYAECVLLDKSESGYELSETFRKLLAANTDFSNMVESLIDYGIDNYREKYSNTYKDTNFQLYQKYTYEDVCRLLNWKKNMNAQNIGGYFYDSETKTLPVFINYHKTEDAIAYEDRFLTNDRLIALSKHPRRVDSSDADHFYKRKEADKDNKIYLFVRKNKDDKEAKEFYFLGEIFAQGEPNPIIMEKTKDNAFEIDYKLEVPIRDDIYDYIVSGE